MKVIIIHVTKLVVEMLEILKIIRMVWIRRVVRLDRR